MVVRVPCMSPDVLRLCSQAPAVLPKPRRGQLDLAAHRGKFSSQEYSVADNKDPNQKQPGEKEPGKFHYNPGNMSGKTAGTKKDESESQSTANNGRGHPAPQNK